MPMTRLEKEDEEAKSPPVHVKKPPPKPRHKPKGRVKHQPPVEEEEPPVESTNIEDLGAEDYETESEPEDEEEDEDEEVQPQGVNSLSSVKPGQRWEAQENWTPFSRGRGRGQPSSRPPQGVRQPNGKVNVSSIIAQAQAMQRQRDKIDQVPPVGQMPPRGGVRR